MRLIDLEELERSLDDSMYVDPYEIPGFLEHCKKRMPGDRRHPYIFCRELSPKYSILYQTYRNVYVRQFH